MPEALQRHVRSPSGTGVTGRVPGARSDGREAALLRVTKEAVLFSSEIKALVGSGYLDAACNVDALLEYLPLLGRAPLQRRSSRPPTRWFSGTGE
jgi:hypothetical protein